MKLNWIYPMVAMAGLLLSACDPKSESPENCTTIVPGQSFTARIGQSYCLPEANWQITFGPAIEDSRCNVQDIECVWAGRFVLEATIRYGDGSKTDTFDAISNWSDTLYNTPYTILLQKVYPEWRDSVGMLPDSAYTFKVLVKN